MKTPRETSETLKLPILLEGKGRKGPKERKRRKEMGKEEKGKGNWKGRKEKKNRRKERKGGKRKGM